jgi:hypothetical protein
MKRPDFGDVLKTDKWFSEGVKGILLTATVQIAAKMFGLPHGLLLGRT